VKRTLPVILTILVAVLTAAAVALAAGSFKVKLGTAFQGSSVHKHYAISVGAKCSVKKCSSANSVLVTITAGNRHAINSPCLFAGYALPLAKIANAKFKTNETFAEPKGPITFTVTGKFTSATKVTGTIVGSKSCGGTDTFTMKGHVVKTPAPVGATGPTG
jgi:hypothetical protein